MSKSSCSKWGSDQGEIKRVLRGFLRAIAAPIRHIEFLSGNATMHLLSLPAFIYPFPTRHPDMRPTDIPEILLNVGEFLPQHSLPSCLRVCKSWHQLLAPLLYRSLSFLVKPWPSEDSILRYAEHIRHLSTLLVDEGPNLSKASIAFGSNLSLQCRNLRSLNMLSVDFDHQESRSCCEALILQNQQLYELRIFGNASSARPQLSWTVVFPQCSPFLQRLMLVGCHLDEQDTAALMKVGSRLQEVYIRSSSLTGTELAVQSQFPLMERITLYNAFDDPAQELRWMAQCPQLRRVNWKAPPIRCLNTLATRLAFKNLQSRPWMQLQEIAISGYLSDSQLAQMLNACGSLRSLVIDHSGFWYRSLVALERHSRSLEFLRLDGCYNLRSWMVQRILSSFPNLISLTTAPILAHELVTSPESEEARTHYLEQNVGRDEATRQLEIARKEYEMVDELNKIMAQLVGSHDVQRVKPWVCLKLVHLEMSIEFPSGHELVGWDEQVFRQISKLDLLESLDVGRPSSVWGHEDDVRGLQLKMQSGMGLLAPIKDLHTLEFVDTCQRMDEQDLLWILHQWPSLRSMSRGLHEDKDIRRTLRRLALETNPKLKFTSNKSHDWDWDNDDAPDEE